MLFAHIPKLWREHDIDGELVTEAIGWFAVVWTETGSQSGPHDLP